MRQSWIIRKEKEVYEPCSTYELQSCDVQLSVCTMLVGIFISPRLQASLINGSCPEHTNPTLECRAWGAENTYSYSLLSPTCLIMSGISLRKQKINVP